MGEVKMNHTIASSMQDVQDYFRDHAERILENPNIGICLFYPNGKIIYANDRFAAVYNVTTMEMYEKRIHEFCRYTVQNLAGFLQKIEQNQNIAMQEMYANGSYYLYKIQSKYRHQQHILVVTLVDITAYKRLELALQKNNKQLEQLRSLDRVTGLNNYAAFETKIRMIHQSKIEENIGMILLDIDGFKRFNQENGYEYGDVAIKKISHLLEHFTEANTQVLFHLGGDEFIFILPNMQDWNLYTFAEQLLVEVHKLNLYFSSGVDCRLTVSLAIDMFTSGEHFDIDFFLVRLKRLMRIAKEKGGHCWMDNKAKNEG
jgi:diguanylate cyclase (GGDEF)-like protein